MSQDIYSKGWKRILDRAEIPHVGTHRIRHRATTEIANSGVPVKVGMRLTAHKTVTRFMRYVHTEDVPVRSAAEVVAMRRKTMHEARIKTDVSTTNHAAEDHPTAHLTAGRRICH
jgi:integrase